MVSIMCAGGMATYKSQINDSLANVPFWLVDPKQNRTIKDKSDRTC